MAIMLPPELASIFAAISGEPWPKANEDDLRTAGDDYQVIADDMPKLKEYIAELVNICLQRFEGEAADAFVASMRELVGQTGGDDLLGLTAEVAKDLAGAAHDTANEVEYTKWMVIAQLVVLVAEIAFDIFWAPFTFGESLVNITWEWALVREAIQIIFKWLFKSILMHTFAGTAQGLLMDATIQGIQIAQGHRHEWNTQLTVQSLEFGVIGGALSGPLDLVGMGLGKFLGGVLGRSAGSILGHELGDAMKGAEHALEIGVRDGLSNLEKDGARKLATEAAKDALGDTAGRWLDKEGAKAFARDLGGVMGAALPQMRQGFTTFGKGTIAEAFEKRFGDIFAKRLGPVLGEETAGQLGRDFGRVFAKEWRNADVELSTELRDLLRTAPISDTGVRALADTLPELAAHMHEGNRLFQVGHALGEQLKEGALNNLNEGFYNVIFSDEHQFSSTWQTFGSGVAMGLLGRIGHHVASPISAKYAQWVSNWQHAPIHEGDSKYFGPLHPLTLMSVAANLAGHPAPFPVPRLGPPAGAADGAHLHDGDTDPLLGSGHVRTESDDDTWSLASWDSSLYSDGPVGDSYYDDFLPSVPVRTHSGEEPSAVPSAEGTATATESDPFPVRTHDDTVPARTDDTPVPARTDDTPVPARTDDTPVSLRTDDTPVPVRTEGGPSPARSHDDPAPTGTHDDTAPVHAHDDAPPLHAHDDAAPVHADDDAARVPTHGGDAAPSPHPHVSESPPTPAHGTTAEHQARVDLPTGVWFPRGSGNATHRTAAHAVPGADGWRVVVGHGTPGKMEIGGRLVGAETALGHIGSDDKLTFATCYAAQPGGDGVALAMDAHLKTGKETLGPTQEAIVTVGGDVISGEFGLDHTGRPVVLSTGDWVVFRDGEPHALGTASLKEAYARLGAQEKPGGPAPGEPVGFVYGVSAAQRHALTRHGYVSVAAEEANAHAPGSFFTSLIHMTNAELTAFYGGTAPTGAGIRQTLSDALLADVNRPAPRYTRFLTEGQTTAELAAQLRDATVWTPQLGALLPHLAADVFHLDLGVMGGDGQVLISGLTVEPHRAGHGDGSPFVLIRVGDNHFVPTQRPAGALGIPVPRAQNLHQGAGGPGTSAWARPLTAAQARLVRQAGHDALRDPPVERYLEVVRAAATINAVAERQNDLHAQLSDLIGRAVHGDVTAVDHLDTLQRIAAEHERVTTAPGGLNETAHVHRILAANDAQQHLTQNQAVIVARAHAYHRLRGAVRRAVRDPLPAGTGVRARLDAAQAAADRAGQAARDGALAIVRARVRAPAIADGTPPEAREAAMARHERQVAALVNAALAPGGEAHRAEQDARAAELQRQGASLYTGPEMDRLRWAMLARSHGDVIERTAVSAVSDVRHTYEERAQTGAEWIIRTDAAHHEQIQADPPRQLPPGFGEPDADGNVQYPLGYRGRVMRIGDAWFGDDVAMSRLVSDHLPAGTALDVRAAVNTAVRERLEGLGNRAVAQRMLEGGLRFRVTAGGTGHEVNVRLRLGDFGRAHHLPAIESQRDVQGPASQSTAPNQKHHVAVESDHENIAGSRMGGTNNRSLTASANLMSPFGEAPNKVMSATVEFSLTGDSSKSWSYGSDGVSATKRLFETEGGESQFEFPDARLTVEIKPAGAAAAVTRTERFPARLGFPKELTPLQPAGGGPVLPAPGAHRGAGNVVHGIIAPVALGADTAVRVDRMLGRVMHLPESISGLGRLRDELVHNLGVHADVDSELYAGIQHWLSETNLLRNYGDLTTIGTLSPAYRASDGKTSAHLEVTSRMVNAQKVGADPVPLKEESQRWVNTNSSDSESGGFGVTPVKATFGYTIGDPEAGFGLNHSFNFGFNVGAKLSTTRTTNENTGAGEVRGLVYAGQSVLYRLTTRMAVEVTGDMKGHVNGGPPLAARDVTTFVRVPVHEADRFEALIDREMAGPENSLAWQNADALVPRDQDPRPTDPAALIAMTAAEAAPHYPPASMAENKGIGFSAIGRLDGAEGVIPEIESTLKKVEFARPWSPDWTPMEQKYLRRQLLAKFSKEALINRGSALFQSGGVKERLYRPVGSGTEVITIRVRTERGALPSDSGRLDQTKLELMPAGFGGEGGSDALSSTLSTSANVSFTGGVGNDTHNALGQVTASGEGNASVGKSASTSVGASGFQIQAMLYNGPARTFDYPVKYVVTVGIEHVTTPTGPGGWPKVVFDRLKAIGKPVDPGVRSTRNRTIFGTNAVMSVDVAGPATDPHKVRFVVPEALAPATPVVKPDTGALTRFNDYAVTAPAHGGRLTGPPERTVRLPALPNRLVTAHTPLNGDDIIMETIGSEHVEAEVRTLLERVGIAPDSVGDISWTATGTEMLTGANVRGPSPIATTLIKQGIIKDSHTVVRIEGYPQRVTATPQTLRTTKMDVAEGGPKVSGSHGSSKDSSFKLNLGFGTDAGKTKDAAEQVFPGISRSGDIPGIPRSSQSHTTALGPVSGRLVQINDHFTEHVGDMAYVITVVKQKQNMFTSDAPQAAASIIQITDGIRYLHPSTAPLDPRDPVISSATTPAPIGTPTVIRVQPPAGGAPVPHALPNHPGDVTIPRFPATPDDLAKINRGEDGRSLPVDPLVPHAAASERLLAPRPAAPLPDVTAEGKPLVDATQRLLQRHAPEMLEAHWQTVGTDPAYQPVPTKLSNLLNLGSAEALIDTMLGPGLILHATRSSVLHNERVWLLLRARRDPHGTGYYHVQPVPNVNVARYHFRLNRSEVGSSRPRDHEWSSSTKVSETPPDTSDRFDSSSHAMTGSASRATSSGRALAQVDASRNTLFVSGNADRYAGPLQIEVALVKTPNPSRTLNTTLFTLPDKLSMLMYDRLDMSRVDGHTSVDLIERVMIHPVLLKPDIQPYVPAAGHVAVQAVGPNSTVADLGGTALHLTKQQLLDRDVINLGFDHDKLQVLGDEVMKRLGKGPENPNFDAAVGRMASHGTRARDAIYMMLSPPMMTNELELMLDRGGLVSPPLVREGGPLTDTHAKVTIRAELFDPLVRNYFEGSLESNTYHFTESNQNRSHDDGWGVSTSSGFTAVSGSTEHQPPGSHEQQKPNGTLSLGGKQTANNSSFVVHKDMPRTVSRHRAENWLRVKTDILLRIRVEARNQRGPLDYPGGTTELAFHIRHGVELSFSPELALRMFDVPELHAYGVPTQSGRFIPANGFPGVTDTGALQLQAARSFPQVAGATVIHVYGDPNVEGNFVVGHRSLTPQQFDQNVLQHHDLSAGRYLIIVGGNGVGVPNAAGMSAADIIAAQHPNLNVISADGPVLTTPGGAVLTGRFAHGHRPLVVSWTGNWILTTSGAASQNLGPDLVDALRKLAPAPRLTASPGAPPPVRSLFWLPLPPLPALPLPPPPLPPLLPPPPGGLGPIHLPDYNWS
jgi:hypothetical protein